MGIFGWSYPPGCNGTPYDEEDYEGEFNEIEKALKELNVGRNTYCWALVGFGWKDADLDPEGCCGIDRILNINDKEIVVEVGGHKTIGDPTCESEWELSEEDKTNYSDAAYEIVCGCGYPGDWTGDNWCLYMDRERVVINWVFNEYSEPDYTKTAEKIIEKSREAVEPFQKEMAYLDKQIDNLYMELMEKYKKVLEENNLLY